MKTTVATGRHVDLQGGAVESGDRLVNVGAEPVLLGRASSCHLVIADGRVSAAHAELLATPEGVRLRDLGSKNGTWLGQARVSSALLTAPTTFSLGPIDVDFTPTHTERVKLPRAERFHDLYGGSAVMREVFARVERAAKTEVIVLVEGETGTGKELLASAIHHASHRAKGPFVVLDCGALQSSLAEAQLFGHVRGAFTGAIRDVTSPFVEASGGTIFLDELGELPIDLQPKLLRALAERRVKPVGGDKYLDFDARVVAATRRDLAREVNAGTFRADLFFRVAQLRVTIPPLRDRPDDIPGLVRVILERLGQARAYKRVTRESLERLLRYDFPGNVRELKNMVSVAVALADEEGPIDLAAGVGGPTEASAALWLIAPPSGARAERSALSSLDYHAAKREALARFERAYFSALMEQTGGNIAEISRRAGLQRTHVRRYVKAHDLKR